MFDKIVMNVLRTSAARNILRRYTLVMVEEELQRVLEDPKSVTRIAMMRIVRGTAKDAVEEAREQIQDKAELDPVYVQWAQGRREARLAAEKQEKAEIAERLRAEQAAAAAAGITGGPEWPAPYLAGRRVMVVSDALFEQQRGVITHTGDELGFASVYVRLEGHRETLPFAPNALELLEEQPAPEDAVTELMPAVEEAR